MGINCPFSYSLPLKPLNKSGLIDWLIISSLLALQLRVLTGSKLADDGVRAWEAEAQLQVATAKLQ